MEGMVNIFSVTKLKYLVVFYNNIEIKCKIVQFILKVKKNKSDIKHITVLLNTEFKLNKTT